MSTPPALIGHLPAPVHAKALHSLFQAAYRQEAALLGVQDFPPLRIRAGQIAADTAHYYGVWQTAAQQGQQQQAQLSAAISLEMSAAAIVIAALVVHPAQQRQGLARQLLEYVFAAYRVWPQMQPQTQPQMQHIQQTRPPPIWQVCTASANTPALSLYRSMGFIEQESFSVSVDGARQLSLLRLQREAA